MTVAVAWGDVATWIAAIGTVGAVVVALRLARADSVARSRADRRRQAEAVTSWISDQYTLVDGENRFVAPVTIYNGSGQLVYRVVISLVKDARGQGETSPQPGHEWRVFLGELPPGRTEATIDHPGGGMHFRAAVELAFRDAAGRSWVRKTDGRLEELRDDPARYYDLSEPLPWSFPGAGEPAQR